MTNILVIDDDIELCELLKRYLESESFQVETSHDGEKAIKIAQKHSFDIIVLDVMLPKMNGFEVLKVIRENQNTPILMLTARGEEVDKIVGLEIGADDYIAKPCNPRELIARIKAILRRSNKSPQKKTLIELDNITIDSNKRVITVNNKVIEVTNAEFNILELLMRSPGQAFSKEELTEYALGRKYTAFDRSIDVHVSNLRNKIGLNKNGGAKIKTVRGYGYLYDA
jgi:two-component system response regulator CpxR